MLGVNSKNPGTVPTAKGRVATVGGGGGREAAAAAWELRPGGMLVQKRNSDINHNSTPVPIIRVKVKYGSSYHEVKINSQASFGELKKMLAGPTGLNHMDQKLVFKDKERDSKAYLDVAGVKDGSKMALFDDVLSREKRLLEGLKIANMGKAKKQIADISLEVDKLAKQVGNLEIEIYGGKKVVEKVLLNLIELLMTQLIKLDGIIAEGDVKLQRRLQVKRVQKYIETLDKLKIRNSMVKNTGHVTNEPVVPLQRQHNKISFQQTLVVPAEKQRDSRNLCGNMQKPVVMVTTEWEKF